MSRDGVEHEDDRRDDEKNRAETPSTMTTNADLTAQVELLAEENRRLREEYVRARQTTHRRTAIGLLTVGVLAVVGAIALPDSRTILLALGGTGLFGGILTFYLTPEQFVSAETGERIYTAYAATGERLVSELGLQADRVYAPAQTTDEEFADVRLFVPQHSGYMVPEPEQLDILFVVADSESERGISLPPTGGGLYREFEASMIDEIAEHPTALATQLADALVEGFELVGSATTDADPDGGRVTVEVAGSVYGSVDRFDHPIVSFLAVGMAAELDLPVMTEVTTDSDRRGDVLVTCKWDSDAIEGAEN